MKLTVAGQYKSIKSFESEELNDFSIITGKNGSGKTQLLNLIASVFDINKRNEEAFKDVQVELTPPILRAQVEGLHFDSPSHISDETFKQALNHYTQRLIAMGSSRKKLYDHLISKGLTKEQLREKSLRSLLPEIGKIELNDLLEKSLRDFSTNSAHAGIDEIDELLRKQLLLSFKDLEVFSQVCSYRQKSILELEPQDFFQTPISERFLDINSLFGSRISHAFIFTQKKDI